MTSLATDLARLGTEFWEWRDATSFRTSDDIPRVERPAGWLPRFDRAAVDEFTLALAGFADRWQALDAEGLGALPVATQVDHRLLGAAMARVHWELVVLRNWQRDAVFLTSQVLGPWFDLLLPPPPFDARAAVRSRARARGDPGRRRTGHREPRARGRRDARTGRCRRPPRHRRATRALGRRGRAADGFRDRRRAPRRAARGERRPRAVPGVARGIRRPAGSRRHRRPRGVHLVPAARGARHARPRRARARRDARLPAQRRRRGGDRARGTATCPRRRSRHPPRPSRSPRRRPRPRCGRSPRRPAC